MRLGIYGGSFNPIHSGHVGVAERAAAELNLDKVLVVPAAVSPFKLGSGPAGGFTSAERMDMVRLACAGHPRLVPCGIELERGGVSYTVDTVREIRRRHPDAELHYIVGEDSLPGLPYWREADELRRMAKFSAYPRTRESSTEIRRRLVAGESVRGLVPDVVARYLSLLGPPGEGAAYLARAARAAAFALKRRPPRRRASLPGFEAACRTLVAGCLERLLPHRPPMVMVDALERFDRERASIVLRFTPHPGSAFRDERLGGVPSWAAVEYMAQAAAACAGAVELLARPDAPPRPGLLLGSRRVSLSVPFFADGRTYRVGAVESFHDEESAAFECEIRDDRGAVVASAVLSAYRPPDFIGFLADR